MSLIISKTPLRISLFGGGTDFPGFFREHGGICITAAINKYVYVIIKNRNDGKLRLSYTKTEIVDEASELQHDLIRTAFQVWGNPKATNLEIVTLADVPGDGSGLASSSAVTVGILKGLNRVFCEEQLKSKSDLARMAIDVETIIRNTPGWQDQIAVTFGSPRMIHFTPDNFVTERILIHPQLPSKLVLFRIQKNDRNSKRILFDQSRAIEENIGKLLRIRDLALEAISVINGGNIDEIGPLLHQSWEIKRGLHRDIAPSPVWKAYNSALLAGATGGKLCGAGGGGHMLLFCPTDEARWGVREVMKRLGHPELQFSFDFEGAVCKRLY